MEKITSLSNETVKKIAKLNQKKYREEYGLFIAEGEKAVSGLINAGYECVSICTTDENFNQIQKNVYLVNDVIMSKISATKSPPAIIGVFKQKKLNKKDFLKYKKLLLIENIKDAGNLGTILRSCKAFDIEGLLLAGDTIDLYNPKVVRASVGCFDLPVINIDYEELTQFENYYLYSTALYEKSMPLSKTEFKKPFIIAFGSEANGLSEEILDFIKRNFAKDKYCNINIETGDSVESLNLATAVSICLYKSFSGI